MAVRVKVEIKTKKENIKTVAVANSGLETYEPELVLPLKLAEKLKLWPTEKGIFRTYTSVMGNFPACSLKNAVDVTTITDKKSKRIRCTATIFEKETEALLSDKLLSALGIVILDAGKGFWRFFDDPNNKIRRSEKRQIWI